MKTIQNWLELFPDDITTVGKPIYAVIVSKYLGYDDKIDDASALETWAIRHIPGFQIASFFEIGLWTEEGSESATLVKDELWEKTHILSCTIFHSLEDLLDTNNGLFNCAGIIRDWI